MKRVGIYKAAYQAEADRLSQKYRKINTLKELSFFLVPFLLQVTISEGFVVIDNPRKRMCNLRNEWPEFMIWAKMGKGRADLPLCHKILFPFCGGCQGSFFRLGMGKFGLVEVSCTEDLFLQSPWAGVIKFLKSCLCVYIYEIVDFKA